MLTEVFSCEDAAQQVLMYVCVSVCGQPENLPFYILLQHPERSRMNAECMQNVPECMHNVTDCMHNVPECIQNVPECMHNVPECFRMHAECSRMHAKFSRMF